MKCPNCKSVDTIENGHAPSSKKRWQCNKCKKTFDRDTGKKYPPTTVPFQFIAFVLYMCKKATLEKTKDYANFLLKFFEVQKTPICSKSDISISAVYNWRTKYGKTYAKLVSIEEAREYFSKLIKKADISFPECTLPEDPKYEIETREVKNPCTTIEALEAFQEMAEYMGENGLEYMKKYPEITEPLIKMFKKGKTKQEFLVKR